MIVFERADVDGVLTDRLTSSRMVLTDGSGFMSFRTASSRSD